MSVEAMAIAMHHSRSVKASTIGVLIGIANHDGDGGAWPTVATLAHYARVSHRQVQRELTELERMGEIKRDIQDGGMAGVAHYDRPNLYHFILKCPPQCDGTRAHKLICEVCKRPMSKSLNLARFHPKCDPAAPQPDRVTPMSPGDTHVTRGVTPMSPETYIETNTHVNETPHQLNREGKAKKDASGDSLRDAAASAETIVNPESCPRWPSGTVPHSYSVLTGLCIDCGMPSVDYSTGEVA